jgi:cysteine desulfurase/selenocysteine lyase
MRLLSLPKHEKDGLSMDNIKKIRKQFPITESIVFMNHAAQSPLPKSVADAIHKYTDDFCKFGTSSIECDAWGKPSFAKLIDARPEEIALIENTSVGLNIAANVLHYPPGSKIVTTDLEYPSVVYPWLRKRLGVKVHYVKSVDGKVSLDDVEKAVDDKTVAVAVSHVEYVNGFRHNLRVLSEIVHEHGAYLIVDAIQSVGTMPINVKTDDVDFLMAACYKWLLSPPGAAYLYVKDELIEKFEPPYVGWASVTPEVFETIDFWDIWNLKLSKTASRFEVGSPSMISLLGAAEAMKILLDYGAENVRRRIIKLTDRLINAVKDLGLKLQTPEQKQCRSGIVNFKMDKPQRVVEKLKERGIIVSARARGVRVSPHFYNTEEEIDRLVEEIKRLKD